MEKNNAFYVAAASPDHAALLSRTWRMTVQEAKNDLRKHKFFKVYCVQSKVTVQEVV
jgi:hypothetical protein